MLYNIWNISQTDVSILTLHYHSIYMYCQSSAVWSVKSFICVFLSLPLSFCLSHSFSLSVSVSSLLCLTFSLSLCLSVCPPVCLSISLSLSWWPTRLRWGWRWSLGSGDSWGRPPPPPVTGIPATGSWKTNRHSLISPSFLCVAIKKRVSYIYYIVYPCKLYSFIYTCINF